MEKIVFLGGGGHFGSVYDSLDRRQYSDVVLLDQPHRLGEIIYGVPVVGSDEDLDKLYIQGFRCAFISVGSVGGSSIRKSLYERAQRVGYSFPCIVDSTAIVSRQGTNISGGVFIGKGTIVNIGASIGACSIINSGAIIEHDCKIGEFVHIAPGVHLSGNVTVGNHTHIGTGSSVIQSVAIGNDTIIGAGSVVVDDIESGVTAVGSPCRPRYHQM